MTEDIKKYTDMLDSIAKDESVPKNIRRSAEKMKKILSNDKIPSIERVAKVIPELEIVGNDVNIPFHTRTMVWGLSSRLESLSANKICK